MNPHSSEGPGLHAAFASLFKHRRLLRDMATRDVAMRYKGSVLGVTWAFLQPLVLLAIYSFVFVVVFNARWASGSAPTGEIDFALFAFVGVIIHGVLGEVISRAPACIIANANYVQRVVFPLEILPVVIVVAACFQLALAVSILLAAAFIFGHASLIGILWLPLIAAPLMLFALGASWLLAATGVFLRDIGQLAGLVSSALMFLAPVFYPLSAVPEGYRAWLFLNPLTYPIEATRAALFDGVPPPLPGFVIYGVFSIVTAQLGYWAFQRARRGFVDVL